MQGLSDTWQQDEEKFRNRLEALKRSGQSGAKIGDNDRRIERKHSNTWGAGTNESSMVIMVDNDLILGFIKYSLDPRALIN